MTDFHNAPLTKALAERHEKERDDHFPDGVPLNIISHPFVRFLQFQRHELLSHAEAMEVKAQSVEQLQVQLAGCGVAALGGTKDVAKRGDYGWSA